MRKFKTSEEVITIEETPSGKWYLYFTANGYNEPYCNCGPFPSKEVAIENVFRLREGVKEV